MIEYLLDGNKKFRKHYFEQDKSLYESLIKKGQQPRYIVIACSDSRVDPAIIMGCQPGDLFVIRNVANLVPTCEHDSHYHGTSAALEFGICALGIKHVIILGHSQCGGITHLLEKSQKKTNAAINTGNAVPQEISEKDSFLSKWMELANSACQDTLTNHPELPIPEQADLCGKTSILHSLENLKTFPWIVKRVQKGELFLHGWYFDLSTGTINFYNPKQQRFEVSNSNG